MDENTIAEIRKGLEQQFRYKLYKDPKYPFLHSMGTKHMFQGFDAQEDGYIGTLHLWWTNESGEPSYYTNNKQFLSGHWKSEWIDDPHIAIQMAIECERKYNPYAQKLMEAVMKDQEQQSIKLAEEMLKKRYKSDMQKATEESKTVLWN